MALVFSGTPAPTRILRGNADIYTGTYTANGVDASMTHEGALAAKVDWHQSRKFHEIMIEQSLNPVAIFPISEEFTIQTTFLEMTLERFRRLTQQLGLTLTGGTDGSTSGTLPLGDDTTENYMQFVVRAKSIPAYGASVKRIIQLWRVTPTSQGSWSFDRQNNVQLQMTFKAVADFSAQAAGKGIIGQIIDA